jgi:hypothetical protein
MPNSIIRAAYERAKHECSADWQGAKAGEAILRLAIVSLQFLLKKCQPIELISRVPGKRYFSFKKAQVVARPANEELFVMDPNVIKRLWKSWLAETVSPQDFARLTYTIALAPSLAMELFDRQNKKGPATFFECYIGHMFAKAVGINPTKKARLPVHGRQVLMTMDFLFDMGNTHRKVHLPVKMSTRERVVQAWAHQRLLDAAYGDGAYRGIMVLFSETKLDSRSLEVVEICVPDQWLAYQALLAHMDRIYYFDVPCRYQALTDKYPEVIVIKPFGEFFREREAVLHSQGAVSAVSPNHSSQLPDGS